MAPPSPPEPLLRRGDAIGVVAPGFAVRRARLDSGVRRLKKMGFEVRLGASVLARDGYLAGDDDARAADLRAMFEDRDLRAIWFARGGYGTARVLDRVPWRRFRHRRPVLVGYSDLTALFSPLVERHGALCLHGPFVTELDDAEAYHAPSLRGLIAGRALTVRLRRRQVLAEGVARGKLIGGNLTVLTHLLGTRYAPSLRGCVLLLEEVGEEVYRIDRCLTQLRMSGRLRGLRGVLLGGFQPAARRRFPPDRDLGAVFRETFEPLGVPVVHDLPFGHMRGKWTAPLGGLAEIDTTGRTVRLDPAVRPSR